MFKLPKYNVNDTVYLLKDGKIYKSRIKTIEIFKYLNPDCREIAKQGSNQWITKYYVEYFKKVGWNNGTGEILENQLFANLEDLYKAIEIVE